MSKSIATAEKIFLSIIQKSNELEGYLASKQWTDAIAAEKQRLTLFKELSTFQTEIPTERYRAFLLQALEFIKVTQPQIDKEIANCRVEMQHFGQQRYGVSQYLDAART